MDLTVQVHAPHLLTLLKEPERLLEVQALSTIYMENDRPALLSDEELFRPERMSLYTLASQYIYDLGTIFFYSSYMEANNLVRHRGLHALCCDH